MEKITNEQQRRLIDKSLDCINSLFSLVNNAVSARESLDWLDANPKARNVLMVVSPNRLPAYTPRKSSTPMLDLTHKMASSQIANSMVPSLLTN